MVPFKGSIGSIRFHTGVPFGSIIRFRFKGIDNKGSIIEILKGSFKVPLQASIISQDPVPRPSKIPRSRNCRKEQ